MEAYVVSTDDSTTYVWSATTSTVHHTLKANQGSNKGSVVVGGDYLISAQSSRAALHVYNLPFESAIKCPVAEKVVLAVSPDRSFLFGGGASGKLYVWALASGALLRVCDGHYRAVSALAVTSDGACLISGGEDGILNAWLVSSLVDVRAESSSPSAQYTWTGHGLRITGIHCGLGPYGETVVLSSSLDCTVKMWKLSSGDLVSDVLFPRAITSLAMDAFEEILFAGASDGTVFCVDFRHSPVEQHMVVSDQDEQPREQTFRSVLSAHSSEITALCVVNQGGRQVLLSGSRDSQIHCWDLESGQLVSSFKRHSGVITSLHVILMAPGCVFDTEKRAVVGKLQKYQIQGDQAVVHEDSGVFWKLRAKKHRLDNSKHLIDGGMQSVVEAPTETVSEAAERRLQELEEECQKLRAANDKLYNLNVEKLLRKSQDGSKSDSANNPRKRGNGRYFNN